MIRNQIRIYDKEPDMNLLTMELRRYGDVLFLDAQKTDINKPGWVYIGPCVKNNEN